MKEKIIKKLEGKTLTEKLDYLTSIYVRAKNKELCDLCEQIRYELIKTLGNDWVVHRCERVNGVRPYRMYLNGAFYREVYLLKDVKKLMSNFVEEYA